MESKTTNPLCNVVKQHYEDIVELKASFSIELSKAKETNDTKRAFELKEAIERKTILLKEAIQGEFEKEMKTFLESSFKSLGDDPSKAKIQAIWQDTTNFKDLVEMPDDKEEFGKYIVNPENAFLDYESMGEPEIFDPNTDQSFKDWLQKEHREKNVNSVMDYVQETYKETHHLPGLEYQKYLFENKDKIPEFLKDGKFYFMPSSAFRYSDGDWRVPFGRWKDSEWRRGARWARGVWFDSERVILFKK